MEEIKYYISEATGKLYDENFVEVPQGDKYQDWQKFEAWLKLGNTPIYFKGTEYELNFVEVPEKVTAIQFIAQLAFEGITEQIVMAVISTLSEPSKTIAKISYQRAVYFERNNPFISLIGKAFGKSEQQLDEIFIKANKL